MPLPFRDIQAGLADTWSTNNCFQGGTEALTGARSLLAHPTKSTWIHNCLSASERVVFSGRPTKSHGWHSGALLEDASQEVDITVSSRELRVWGSHQERLFQLRAVSQRFSSTITNQISYTKEALGRNLAHSRSLINSG